MNEKTSRFAASFLEHQKHQLSSLRAALIKARATQDAEKKDAQAASASEAREYEEDAQHLDMLELDGNLENRSAARLEQIERALQKITDGTYGTSDASGQPIPLERLEAVPEAIYTLAEQQAKEPAG